MNHLPRLSSIEGFPQHRHTDVSRLGLDNVGHFDLLNEPDVARVLWARQDTAQHRADEVQPGNTLPIFKGGCENVCGGKKPVERRHVAPCFVVVVDGDMPNEACLGEGRVIDKLPGNTAVL